MGADRDGEIESTMTVSKLNGVERIFYSAPEAGGNVRTFALNTVDGAGAALDDCITPGQSTGGAGALAFVNGVESFVTVVKDNASATLLAYRFDQAVETDRCRRFTTGLSGLTYPGNVAASSADVFFGDENGAVQSFALGGSWTGRANFPVTNVFPRSSALTASDVVVAGRLGALQGRAVAISKANGALGWTYPAGAGFIFPAWSPSVGPLDHVLYSEEGRRLRLVTIGQAVPIKEVTLIANAQAAPLFGEKGLIYVAEEDGGLSSWDSALNLLWREDIGIAGAEASPTIDCSRDNNGSAIPGRPGVLYVAGTNGFVNAIIVDSKGLDTTAAWPKYQHDPRNTGNSATPLSEFACP